MGEASGSAADRDAEIRALGLLERRPPDVVHHLLQAAKLLTGASTAQLNVITSQAQETLVDSDGHGSTLALEDAVCPRVLAGAEADVAVPDAGTDPRLAGAGVVKDGTLVGYAASKLVTSAGVEIGTVCVFSDRVLPLDARMATALQHVTAATMVALESRRVHQHTSASLSASRTRSAELGRSNEHLLAFASQIGHDVQGPLATVSLSLDLLSEHLGVSPEADDAAPVTDADLSVDLRADDTRLLLRPARAGVRRLQATVKGLLDFALLGGRLDLVPVGLDALAREVLLDLGAWRGSHVVELHDLPEVVADAAMMRTVLLNLVGNAFKHGGRDRPVTVRVSGSVRPEVTRIVVEDDGPGVPRAQWERIFEPLARVESEAASVPGLGIGLASCRRVARLHGGRLSVEHSDAGGARFVVELPARLTTAPATAPVEALA